MLNHPIINHLQLLARSVVVSDCSQKSWSPSGWPPESTLASLHIQVLPSERTKSPKVFLVPKVPVGTKSTDFGTNSAGDGTNGAMGKVGVEAWKCEVCGHVWVGGERPKRCARCKSRRWDDGGQLGKAGGDRKRDNGVKAADGNKFTSAKRSTGRASDKQPNAGIGKPQTGKERLEEPRCKHGY